MDQPDLIDKVTKAFFVAALIYCATVAANGVPGRGPWHGADFTPPLVVSCDASEHPRTGYLEQLYELLATTDGMALPADCRLP